MRRSGHGQVKTDMLRSNSKSLGNHVVSAEEEKERLHSGKDLQQRKVSSCFRRARRREQQTRQGLLLKGRGNEADCLINEPGGGNSRPYPRDNDGTVFV